MGRKRRPAPPPAPDLEAVLKLYGPATPRKASEEEQRELAAIPERRWQEYIESKRKEGKQ